MGEPTPNIDIISEDIISDILKNIKTVEAAAPRWWQN